MSDWLYIGLAYGVTLIALLGYTLYLRACARRAEALWAEADRREVGR
jgi:heme exporter protein D